MEWLSLLRMLLSKTSEASHAPGNLGNLGLPHVERVKTFLSPFCLSAKGRSKTVARPRKTTLVKTVLPLCSDQQTKLVELLKILLSHLIMLVG